MICGQGHEQKFRYPYPRDGKKIQMPYPRAKAIGQNPAPTEMDCILWPVPAFAWAPVHMHELVTNGHFCRGPINLKEIRYFELIFFAIIRHLFTKVTFLPGFSHGHTLNLQLFWRRKTLLHHWPYPSPVHYYSPHPPLQCDGIVFSVDEKLHCLFSFPR